MITLTRRYHFSASHRLHVDALSDQENSEIFGKCNNPFGHGHDYILSVTVQGRAGAKTGLIVQVSALDNLVETEVLSLFAHRNINLDVAAICRSGAHNRKCCAGDNQYSRRALGGLVPGNRRDWREPL